MSQVYHRVEVLTDSPKDTSAAAAGCANVEEAASVHKENLFCKPVSSGNEPPTTFQHHLSQESEQQGLSQLSTQQGEASPHQKPYVSVKSAKKAVVKAMKKPFYAIYGKIHEDKVQAGCQLMFKTTYDKIMAAVINFNKSDTKDIFMRNAKSRYMLKKNVRSDNLFCKVVKQVKVDKITQVERYERKALWYERAFHIIHQTHLKLAHSTYKRTHKTTIDNVWWGLPENSVQIYINLCPDCVQSTKPPVAEQMNPLRMIISKTVGCRAQMDLVDF